MAANGISTLATKELRQIAKLDLAAQRRGESYDIDLLPTKYDGNNLVNNPNHGGLQPHRPWINGAPPGPSSNQVISLNPNYIATYGGTSIPNDTDEGSTSATVVGTFISSPAQGGTITLMDFHTSAIYLPPKHVKTIGMWIKIINQQTATQYLLDSRERDGPNAGSGTGYFYTGGYEGWTLMSINGNPADTSNWFTVANNTNAWQYVTLINQTDTPFSITLFNRYSLEEGLATIQVGLIEAWDYILVDSQIAAAYASYSSNYV